jgi:D-mannonate dehydratase
MTSTMAAGAAALTGFPERVVSQVRNTGRRMKFTVDIGAVGTNGTPEETIQYCKDLEIEGVSVPWPRVPGYQEKGYIDPDRVKALKAQIEEAGLTLSAMVLTLPETAVSGTADGEAAIENARRSLKAMAAAKVDTLVTFVPVNLQTPWEQVVGVFHKLVPEAERSGVRLATHTGAKGLATYERLFQLIHDVPSANVGFTYCTGNMWHDSHEKMYDIPREISSKIFFVHVRSVRSETGEKEYFFDQGDIDFPRVVAAFKKFGYSSWVRSEHMPMMHSGRPGAMDLTAAWALGYMKALISVV